MTQTCKPSPVRNLCALIACRPSALDREPYVTALAERTGYSVEVVRREIDAIARTGQAPNIFKQLDQGMPAKVEVTKAGESEIVLSTSGEGWWNRPRGETESGWYYFYRTQLRLLIVERLLQRSRFEEWWRRVADRSDQCGDVFEAEWATWREMLDEEEKDPLNYSMGALCYGTADFIGGDLFATESPARQFAEVVLLYGSDWYEEYAERLASGETEEAAIKGTLSMVKLLLSSRRS